MSPLAGKRVLIVEDEFLVATMASDAIESADGEPVGPCATVEAALRCLESEVIDAALLDVNLRGTRSDPVAAALMAKRIPFVTATGYSSRPAFAAHVLEKPYSEERLLAEFCRLFSEIR